MKTTIRLNAALLDRARKEAARRGTTVTALIEQGLRLVLRSPLKPSNRPRVTLPECRVGGGVHAGVNLDRAAELLDRID